MALTGLDYFALYKLIDDELPTNASNLIKAINTRNVTKRMTDTFFTLGSMRVIEHLRNDPTVSPQEGDTYTVGLVPTGVWVGHENKIAVFSNTIWNFIEPGDRLHIITIDVPEQKYFFRGIFPAGNWFIETTTGTGNLLSDGSIPMDNGYDPVNPLDIATRQFVIDNAGDGTVQSVNDELPDGAGNVELDSSQLPDVSGVTAGTTADSLIHLNVEKVEKDGSVDMDPGYTPGNDQSVATKKYVDDKPSPFAGKYDFIGSTSFPALPPVLDDNIGQLALYFGEFGEQTMFMSSFDKEGYPYAFYVEAVCSNNEDNLTSQFGEGSAFSVLLTQPAGAFTGLVKKVRRNINFELEMSDVSSFSFSSANNQASIHIEADLSYTRNRTFLNASHFSSSGIGPQRLMRSQNFVLEKAQVTRQFYEFQDEVNVFEGHDLTFTSNTITFGNDTEATQVVEFKCNTIIVNNTAFTADIPTVLRLKNILTDVAGPITLQIGDNITLEYEKKSSNITIETFNGGTARKTVWQDSTYADTIVANDEQSLLDALTDQTIENIVIEKPITFTQLSNVALTNNKTIRGSALTMNTPTEEWGISFSGAYTVKMYNDIVVTAGNMRLGVSNVVPDTKLQLRNIFNTGGDIYLSGIGTEHEWAASPDNALDEVAGIPVLPVFWDNTFKEIVNIVNQGRTTSILVGGTIQVNGGDNTILDIAAGRGTIVDHLTSPGNPIITELAWPAQSIFMPDISSQDFSGIYIDVNGSTQAIGGLVFTEADRRTKLVLGTVLHVSHTVIEEVTNGGIPTNDWVQAFMDYSMAAGGIVKGSDVLLSNADQTFELSTGTYTSPFINRGAINSPSTITNAGEATKEFTPSFQDGTGGYDDEPVATEINPELWDDGSGTLVTVTNNDWTFRPVFFLPSFNRLVIPYGQTLYETKALAIDGITESFGTFQVSANLKNNAQLLGFFILEEGMTDLQDSVFAEYIIVTSRSIGGTGDPSDGFNSIENTGTTGVVLLTSLGTTLRMTRVLGKRGIIAELFEERLEIRDQPTVNSNVSTATLNINSNEVTQETVTALAVDLAIGLPTGSPADGQVLKLRIRDNGVARNLSWNAVFREIGAELPTITVPNKLIYLGFIYNGVDNQWDVVGFKPEV